jgi:hypothetical protein
MSISLKNIPALIKVTGEEYTTRFAQLHKMLNDMRNDYGLDLDPDFQRGHVWSLNTKVKFIEYLLRGGKVNPIFFNCPDYSYSYKESDAVLSKTVVLVDGKQRLTAILEFLDNKVPVFGHYLNDFEDKDFIVRHFGIRYVVNSLQTRKEMLTWYLEINEGHIAHTTSEIKLVYDLLEQC